MKSSKLVPILFRNSPAGSDKSVVGPCALRTWSGFCPSSDCLAADLSEPSSRTAAFIGLSPLEVPDRAGVRFVYHQKSSLRWEGDGERGQAAEPPAVQERRPARSARARTALDTIGLLSALTAAPGIAVGGGGRAALSSHDQGDAMSVPREDAERRLPDLTEVIVVLEEDRIVTKATGGGGGAGGLLAPPSLSGSLSGSRSMLAGPGPGPSKLVHDFTITSGEPAPPRAHCHRHIDTAFVVVVLLAMLVLVIAECISMKRTPRLRIVGSGRQSEIWTDAAAGDAGPGPGPLKCVV
ncbi:DNA primase TraC [Frankliniella fusca]|uniref:DNA primase TraC n=1 Tax=Frankliniella fusca TaxID=407009 RepID=A0AAE1GYA5_9NEOP|nr:DNA primase TraC [Frankliniella fusca]